MASHTGNTRVAKNAETKTKRWVRIHLGHTHTCTAAENNVKRLRLHVCCVHVIEESRRNESGSDEDESKNQRICERRDSGTRNRHFFPFYPLRLFRFSSIRLCIWWYETNHKLHYKRAGSVRERVLAMFVCVCVLKKSYSVHDWRNATTNEQVIYH